MKTVLVTGSQGLMGSAISNMVLPDNWFLIKIDRTHGNLTIEDNVIDLFRCHHPNYVIHTAAKVGGIGGNLKGHGDYFRDNILMNTHIIHQSMLHNVEKLIMFSSVCVFPHDLALLEEDKMHNGPVFESNFAYGYSKRMVDIMIRAYKSQYGVKNYCSVIPGNIAGEYDNYSLTEGHVMPMLIHKMYRAKHFGEPFKVWGDGQSLREFLYAGDVAKWIVELLQKPELPERIIMSGEKEYSIKHIVDLLCQTANYTGEVIWETDKPNGQRCRPSSKKIFNEYIQNARYTSIEDLVSISYKWFEQNYPNVRGIK